MEAKKGESWRKAWYSSYPTAFARTCRFARWHTTAPILQALHIWPGCRLKVSSKVPRLFLKILPRPYPGPRGFSWFFLAKEIKSKPVIKRRQRVSLLVAFATRCRRFAACSWSLSRRKIKKNQEPITSGTRGPFLESPGNFTGPKSNIPGAPNDRFLGNDLKWLVMHPVVL